MMPDVIVSNKTRNALRRDFILVNGAASTARAPGSISVAGAYAARVRRAADALNRYNGGSACARSSRAARAKVAELVDALDLGSSGVTRAGSSPAFRMYY